jgi:hypothetical protein
MTVYLQPPEANISSFVISLYTSHSFSNLFRGRTICTNFYDFLIVIVPQICKISNNYTLKEIEIFIVHPVNAPYVVLTF